MDKKERIAWRVAQELSEGAIVNLGIGIPTLVPKYVSEETQLTIHSENGALGIDPQSKNLIINPALTDAGGKSIRLKNGAMVFDSAYSFSIVRNGIIDFTILGALEVDRYGNLSNWIVPNKIIPGMGGAMDLLYGAKKVIVAMEHTNKNGESKIVERCSLPLTGTDVVDKIITELAVFSIVDNQLLLEEIMPESSLEMIMQHTDANFMIKYDIYNDKRGSL